ncbi:MAG: 3-isopropylmalate dehydratase [Burkholderiaceae bacterium]
MSLHRVWRVGSNIDTDALAPGKYMKLGLKEMSRHCLENDYPGLAANISSGDVLVAGANFGIGSSREQAVGVLVELGVKAVIAPSFGGLYFRNAFNLGLLAIVCPDAGSIGEGALVEIDTGTSVIRRAVRPSALAGAGPVTDANPLVLSCQKIPGFLIDMVVAGGLFKQLEQEYLAKHA